MSKAPLPEPKPWIRRAGEIMEQAQTMMTPPADPQLELLEDDPE